MAQQQSKNKSIYQKIVDIQQKLKAPKNQYNNYGKFYYRSTEDILEALKPLLHKYDLVQTIHDEIEQCGDRIYIKAVVTVTDTETEKQLSHQAFAREEEKKGSMDAMQLTGATSTYARKYALNGLWLIDDTKDSDDPSTQEQEKQNKTSNVKAAAKEKTQSNQQSDDDLTDGKSQAAFQVALQKFKDCTSKEEITQHGRAIMQQGRKEGLKEGDENKLKQEINQLYDTLPEKAGDGQQEGNQSESTTQS